MHQANVQDVPGTTVDNLLGISKYARTWLMDTKGIEEKLYEDPKLLKSILKHAQGCFYIIDASKPYDPMDRTLHQALVDLLGDTHVHLIFNKMDRIFDANLPYRFGDSCILASIHERNFDSIKSILSSYEPSEPQAHSTTRIAIIGRPNVGKSTLFNRILRADEAKVSPTKGTTRDAIIRPLKWHGTHLELMDTAGIQRRHKKTLCIEHQSILQSFEAIYHADIVLLMLNAQEGITFQDVKLLHTIETLGKGCLVLINKVDDLDSQQKAILEHTMHKLKGFPWCIIHKVSATHGKNLKKAAKDISTLSFKLKEHYTTAQLNKILLKLTENHQPPLIQGRRIKMNYIHVIKNHPLTLQIHGKQVNKLPKSYIRYLASGFYKYLQRKGLPIEIKLKQDLNPYHKEK